MTDVQGKCPQGRAEEPPGATFGRLWAWAQSLEPDIRIHLWNLHSEGSRLTAEAKVVMADRPEEGRTRFGVGLTLGFSPDHAT